MRIKPIKVLFVILYGLYTLVAVNTKLVEQIIPYGNFYVCFYILILVLLFLIFHYKPLVINWKDASFKTIGLLTLYIIIFGIISALEGPDDSLGDELLAFGKYIMVAAVTIYFVKQFDLISELLLASFFGGSGLLIYEFALAGFPLDIFSRLGTFFSADYSLRYRVDFGFNNFNTVGNISACLLIVYILLMSWVRNTEGRSFGRTLKIWICTAIAVIDFIVLLSSGSRNSLLTIIVFVFAILYFKFTDFKRISIRQKTVFKFLLILIGGIVLYFSVFNLTFEMFETSGRLRSFEINIPLVFNNERFFEGLGLMTPGLFGRVRLGYIVDNYYLYVFMETGLIGLVMIASLLFKMSEQIHSLRLREEPFYLLLSSAFVAWLISGIGETCVIYPSFASSLMFFVIFVSISGIEISRSED